MIVKTIIPEEDSQYRLLPCGCTGKPEYQLHDTLRWGIKCPPLRTGAEAETRAARCAGSVEPGRAV